MAEDGADAQPWHSPTEAARLTGLDRKAIRSRARRGLLPSRKNNRNELLMQLPAELLAGVDRDDDQPSAVADLSAEVGELRIALAKSEAERDASARVMAAEVAAVRAEVAAGERIITELKVQLDHARLPWWSRWRKVGPA
jgi:hypothetical protein